MELVVKTNSLRFLIKEGKRIVGVLEGENNSLLLATFFNKGDKKTSVWSLDQIPEKYNLEPIFITNEEYAEWKKAPILKH